MSWYRIKIKHKGKRPSSEFALDQPDEAKQIQDEPMPAQNIVQNQPGPIGTTTPTDAGIQKLNILKNQQDATKLRNSLLEKVHNDASYIQIANQEIMQWNSANPEVQLPEITLDNISIVEFRKNLLAKVKENIDANIPNETANQKDATKAFNKIKKILSEAQIEIDTFNKSNPTSPLAYISWQEFPELIAPTSGVQGFFLLPYSGQGQGQKDIEGQEHQDTNADFIIKHLQSVFTNYGITDDKAGAELLAILASNDEYPDVRLIVNEYFAAKGRKNFHQIIKDAGFETLADEFAKIPKSELQYKLPYEMNEQDTVFGEDYGLETRSEAERQILVIFRALDLQPIPVEIKMPSTKMRQNNKDVGTEFMCDFLLPCDVLNWKTDETGLLVPEIKEKMIFVGEYLGFYSLKSKNPKEDEDGTITKDEAKRNKIVEDYVKKTAVKKELQPIQTFLVGGDVIHISKDDFESGGNSYKLIYQLEQLNIIFKGSRSEIQIQKWKSDPNQGGKASPEVLAMVDQSLQKMSPELSIVKATMMQLQFKFGELAKFFKNYYNPENSEYRELVQNYYAQYAGARTDEAGNQLPSLQQEQFRLNEELRRLTYRRSTQIQRQAKDEFEEAKSQLKTKLNEQQLKRLEMRIKQRVYAENYSWASIAQSKDGKEFEDLMVKLQSVANQIKSIYSARPDDPNALSASSIREKHLEALENSTDDQGYQPRLQELKTLENCLEQPQQPSCSFLPQDPKQLPAFVASICNNALSGLKVTLTRETKKQEDIFVPRLPKFSTALNKYKKIIQACNIDIFFNPKKTRL